MTEYTWREANEMPVLTWREQRWSCRLGFCNYKGQGVYEGRRCKHCNQPGRHAWGYGPW